jgi:hypothetical protein
MSFTWNFENIPDIEKESIRALVSERNARELIKMHDKYKLSNYTYCCGDASKQVLAWFDWAIENGKI